MPVVKKPAPKPRIPFTEIVESRRGPLRAALTDFYDAKGRWTKRKSVITSGYNLIERRKHIVDKEGPKHIQDVYDEKGKLVGSVITPHEPLFDSAREGDRLLFDVRDKRRGQIRTIDAIRKGRFDAVNIAHLGDWLSTTVFDRPVFDEPAFARNLAEALTKAPHYFFKEFSDARMGAFARYVAEHKFEFMSGISANPDGFRNSLHRHKYNFAKSLEAFILEDGTERKNARMIVFKLTGVNLEGEGRLSPAMRQKFKLEEWAAVVKANAELRAIKQAEKAVDNAVVIKKPPQK